MMGFASTKAKIAASTPAMGMVAKTGQWYTVLRIAVVYAPMAKKAVCPMWNRPVCPRMRLSERASAA